MECSIVAPCHFGLEAVLKREIADLGLGITEVEDGRVIFKGGLKDIARANICLRTAERILIECGRFTATTYDELFEGIKNIPWEEYIPKDGKFWVKKAFSVKSKLFSPSDIQSIAKKAMVERLKLRYGINWFDEDGASYPVRISIKKDLVSVCLDTSGDSLHKRGYRISPVIAPLSETLAASIIALTPWRRGRILADPCCGSGTIPIEAAMMAANIAPGLKRDFLAETWAFAGKKKLFTEVRLEEKEKIDLSEESDIQGFDIDRRAVAFARDNAKAAGVEKLIHFQERPLSGFSHAKKYGFIITNPPYGERIGQSDELDALYRQFGEVYERLDSWSMYLLSSYENSEKCIGRKADKNRKIYNGMIKTRLYQYLGPRPGKRG